MEKRDEKKKKSWFFRFVLFLGLIVLGFISWSITRETIRNRQVQKEIDQLREEAKKIERENTELSEKISYFESKDFQEKEAKDKLNLQSPNENVVVIKPDLTKGDAASVPAQAEEKKLVVKISNIQKWWDYFFKY